MSKPRMPVCIFFTAMTSSCACVAFAQNYPFKPIRIVTGSPGSGIDLTSRLLAPGLTGGLGQQVIVENRGGILSTEFVVKAPPDAHTLLLDGFTIWLLPFLRDDVSYDPLRDLAPVALLVSSPNMIVVHPSLPIRTVKDLIALAKAQPGALNYASGSIGGAPHLAVELFKAMAGVNIVHVPYKGTAGGVTDLISGQVQLMISTVASLTPQVKSGRLRALAVTTAQPSALAPGLPTVAASGLPGYESTSVYGMLTTGKSPQPSVSRLNQEVVRVLNRADMKEKMLSYGLEVIASSPEELAATMKSDMAKWGKLIKDLGIRG